MSSSRPETFDEVLRDGPRALERLDSADATERLWASWAVALANPQEQDALLASRLSTEPSEGVRASLLPVIARAARASLLLEVARADPSSLVRESAARLLAQMARDVEALGAALVALVRESPDARVRVAVVQAFPQPGARGLAVLQAALDDEALEVQLAAVERWLEHASAPARLEAELLSRPALRDAVARAAVLRDGVEVAVARAATPAFRRSLIVSARQLRLPLVRLDWLALLEDAELRPLAREAFVEGLLPYDARLLLSLFTLLDFHHRPALLRAAVVAVAASGEVLAAHLAQLEDLARGLATLPAAPVSDDELLYDDDTALTPALAAERLVTLLARARREAEGQVAGRFRTTPR